MHNLRFSSKEKRNQDILQYLNFIIRMNTENEIIVQ